MCSCHFTGFMALHCLCYHNDTFTMLQIDRNTKPHSKTHLFFLLSIPLALSQRNKGKATVIILWLPIVAAACLTSKDGHCLYSLVYWSPPVHLQFTLNLKKAFHFFIYCFFFTFKTLKKSTGIRHSGAWEDLERFGKPPLLWVTVVKAVVKLNLDVGALWLFITMLLHISVPMSEEHCLFHCFTDV